ncbi:MAG: dephospho-CoA kinase, partial [Proteobacteria bacterium]|nr:dephospho-CoA kinase [Pseudomonadota bacterium]
RAMADSEISRALAADATRPVVLEAAVLIEADWLDLVDEVWVTVVAPAVAIERACARDNLTAEAVQARLDAQLSNAQRCARADRVIDNSADEATLVAQVHSLWAQLT